MPVPSFGVTRPHRALTHDTPLHICSGKFNSQDTDVLARCIYGLDVLLEVPQGKSVRVKPDVLIVNQGVWYNAPAEHISKRQAHEAGLLRKGFHEAIAVPLMQRNATLPSLIWRETAPQRFNTPGGLFDTFRKVDPLRNVSCERRPVAELHRYNWRNTALEPELATLGGRVRTLPIFDLSAGYPKIDQPKAGDCTHFALPGPPDTWSHLLLATLVVTRGSSRRGRQRSGPHLLSERRYARGRPLQQLLRARRELITSSNENNRVQRSCL